MSSPSTSGEAAEHLPCPPLRISLVQPQLAVFTAVCAAIVVCRIFLDHGTAQYLDAQPRDAFWWFFRYVSYLGEGRYWALIGLVGVALPWLAERWPNLRMDAARARRAGLLMLAALAGSAITMHLLKFVIGRARPRVFLDTGFEAFHPFALKSASFPSGHTQTIWAAMVVLAIAYPRHRWAYIIFAVMVSLSRLVLVKHYPSDVVAGAWLGAVWAVLLTRHPRFQSVAQP